MNTLLTPAAPKSSEVDPILFESCRAVHLSLEDNSRLLQYFERICFYPHQVIADFGEVGESLYYIVDGEAILHNSEMGTEMEVARVQRGELMGEMSFFDRMPRLVQIRAGKYGATVYRLSREAYERLREEFPAGAALLLEGVIISLDHIFRRTAHYLCDLSQYLYGVTYRTSVFTKPGK
jgi:CRP/FNR family transcriptional regulator, cyclic AMP receptor protein